MTLARARDGAELLARSVLSLRPLVDALPPPVAVAWSPSEPLASPTTAEASAAAQTALDALALSLRRPRLLLGEAPKDPAAGLFARVVGESLDPALRQLCRDGAAPPSSAELDRAARRADAESFEQHFPRVELRSLDGTPFHAYAGGDPDQPPVVVVSACGMPARLCERWIRWLSQSFFVLTWESRGLFLEDHLFDRRGFDVHAQATDLVAMMDHFGVASAHLMGMCGGVILALAAAATWPSRVSSLSLWHGDYELGPDCPKTDHQHNLKALLDMAAESRQSAAAVRRSMCHAMLQKSLPEQAATVLYPYANAELAYRYGRLNGSIMSTNAGLFLDRVRQPVAVVTSLDDATAHPEGSRRVAARLSDATLWVEPHGDHLSLFRAEASVRRLASNVLRGGAAIPHELARC